MSAPPSRRHDALGDQPAPSWSTLRQLADRLQSAARPRFLSSVLVLALAGLVVALLARQLLAWLLPWLGL